MRDPHTKDSRGFGFVTMEIPEDGEAALAATHGKDLNGKPLNVAKVSNVIFTLSQSSINVYYM
jgi:transformer-2 protein